MVGFEPGPTLEALIDGGVFCENTPNHIEGINENEVVGLAFLQDL